MARSKQKASELKVKIKIGDIVKTTGHRIGFPAGTPCLVLSTRKGLICTVQLFGNNYKGRNIRTINIFNLKIINPA
jgi:hypothetical protein